MRYIMSVDEEELEDYLNEIYIKDLGKINFFNFFSKDHLCMELFSFLALTDSPKGRSVIVSFIQQSSLPFLKIICTFMFSCFMSKLKLFKTPYV